MRIVNAEPRGATVYITDLKVRIGQDGIIVNVADATASNDLRVALDQGMVFLEASSAEREDPLIADLLTFARRAAAKREGLLLFATAESSLRAKTPITPEVTIRRAVFRPIAG